MAPLQIFLQVAGTICLHSTAQGGVRLSRRDTPRPIPPELPCSGFCTLSPPGTRCPGSGSWCCPGHTAAGQGPVARSLPDCGKCISCVTAILCDVQGPPLLLSYLDTQMAARGRLTPIREAPFSVTHFMNADLSPLPLRSSRGEGTWKEASPLRTCGPG